MAGIYADIDFSSFWDNNEYAVREYVGAPVTDEMIASVQDELGYKLPVAYVELLRVQNGGVPKNTNHRTQEPTSWANDHVAITGIYGIDQTKDCSIAGDYRSQFWIDEWGYPDIGIYVCDCPSAGHDMICLDYSQCGKDGDPAVVHVDQESDYQITLVAPSFESFIHGLEADSAFE
ncbi:MAG: SMI1/KNR4 family protein [Planctomycetota bacterium]